MWCMSLLAFALSLLGEDSKPYILFILLIIFFSCVPVKYIERNKTTSKNQINQ